MRSAYPDRVYHKWLVPAAAALVLLAAGYCSDGLTGAASMAGGKIAYAEEAADAPALITGIDVSRQEQDTLVTISGSKPLTYTAVKLQAPLKIMVDMPDCTMEKTMGPGGVDSDLVSEVTSQAIQKGERNYLRVEIALKKDVTYTVNPGAFQPRHQDDGGRGAGSSSGSGSRSGNPARLPPCRPKGRGRL